jgi:uncharacterized coiled-coil protein SlyX
MDADARLARLEERTEHLQTDVTEIKSVLRRIDVKLDAVKDSVHSLAQRVAAFEPKLDAMAASFEAKLGAMASSLDAKLGAQGSSFDAKLNAMEAGIIKWMIGTLIAATAAAFAIAKFVS